MTMIFLHGLESSSRGTKATWFRQRYPAMLIPNLSGPLAERMVQMEQHIGQAGELVLVGSSFGGLMAALYASEYPDRVARVILLAPALNFPEFLVGRERSVSVPAWLFIGSRDEVCPPDIVIPAARKTFSDLYVQVSDDDHLLRVTFPAVDWPRLLAV